MKRTWTIVGVSDVHDSLTRYQSLFGQPQTPPSQDYFGQILDADGTVLLCLRRWRARASFLDEPRDAMSNRALPSRLALTPNPQTYEPRTRELCA